MNILTEINDLIDQHGENFINCPGCPICDKISSLRVCLERSPEERYEHILSKGEEMTTGDVKFLLRHGVHKRAIKKALHMKQHPFQEFIGNFSSEDVFL